MVVGPLRVGSWVVLYITQGGLLEVLSVFASLLSVLSGQAEHKDAIMAMNSVLPPHLQCASVQPSDSGGKREPFLH